MTGPEHYKLAEQHIEWAGAEGDQELSDWHQQQAIAHGLAALAAATAASLDKSREAWHEAGAL